jgi:hypothetical protein
MDRIVTMHFNDGTKLSFDFPEQAKGAAARSTKVSDFMSGKHLVIAAEGQVFFFPVTSIKYITISTPALTAEGLGALPRHAIVGARVRG